MAARESLRIGFLLNRHGSLEAAGVVRGDIAEGARFLEALRDPLSRFVEEARREAARLSSQPRETPAKPAPVR
jgi:hypothetical protein